MRGFSQFLLFILVGLTVGALSAYPLHLVVDTELQRLITRVGQVFAVLTFIPFVMLVGLYAKGPLGYALPRRQFLYQMLVGVLVGLLIMALISALLLLLGVRDITPRPDFSWLLLGKIVTVSLVAGTLIGIMEETFFRGALLTAILRTRGVVTAVVMSSLFYAALHFVHTKSVAISGEPGWYTGLVVLFGSFHKFTELSTLDSFLALFMAGIFLCTVRLRRGNIAFCIGIHAGWVMVIKLMKTYTHHLHDSEYAFLIGEYDGIIGYLALFFISTIALVYYLATTQKHHYFTGKG